MSYEEEEEEKNEIAAPTAQVSSVGHNSNEAIELLESDSELEDATATPVPPATGHNSNEAIELLESDSELEEDNRDFTKAAGKSTISSGKQLDGGNGDAKPMALTANKENKNLFRRILNKKARIPSDSNDGFSQKDLTRAKNNSLRDPKSGPIRQIATKMTAYFTGRKKAPEPKKKGARAQAEVDGLNESLTDGRTFIEMGRDLGTMSDDKLEESDQSSAANIPGEAEANNVDQSSAATTSIPSEAKADTLSPPVNKTVERDDGNGDDGDDSDDSDDSDASDDRNASDDVDDADDSDASDDDKGHGSEESPAATTSIPSDAKAGTRQPRANIPNKDAKKYTAFIMARRNQEVYHENNIVPTLEQSIRDTVACYRQALLVLLGREPSDGDDGDYGGMNKAKFDEFNLLITSLVTQGCTQAEPVEPAPLSILSHVETYLKKHFSSRTMRDNELKVRTSSILDAVLKMCGLVKQYTAGKILLVRFADSKGIERTDFLAWVPETSERTLCRGAQTQARKDTFLDSLESDGWYGMLLVSSHVFDFKSDIGNGPKLIACREYMQQRKGWRRDGRGRLHTNRVNIRKQTSGWNTITVHRLTSIVAHDLDICCWDCTLAKHLLGGKSFHEALGIPPTDDQQRKKMEKELRYRPRNCDCDRLFGCDQWYNSGLFGWCPVSHRENSIRSWVRRKVKDWCFGPFKGVYTGGSASPYNKQCKFELPIIPSKIQKKAKKWEDHLSQLADYKDIHGHCNVPRRCSKLNRWVRRQRSEKKLYDREERSGITPARIQALENLGFAWDVLEALWMHRLSELADYKYIHGHCNVPSSYSENTKLAAWVNKQRREKNDRLQKQKQSFMTPFRIQELEGLGFQWDRQGAAWEERLSELTDYHRIHGHCNVPQRNSKLGKWVSTQRTEKKLYDREEGSQMTPARIEALEGIGFQWNLG
jgi:hypothetical protein